MKNVQYSFIIQSNFHLENFFNHNNQNYDSFFWLEEHDYSRQFFFSSALLNELENIEEIYHIGAQILSIYEGIYTLLDRNKNLESYFILRELVDVESNRIISKSTNPEVYKIDLDFSKIVEIEEHKPKNQVYILFNKVIKDGFLTNLFFLLSNKVDYKMLYMIYDDLRHFLRLQKDKEFLKEFSEALNRFSHTANNYEVLGFYARHGSTNHEPPKSPMNLEDSKNLIFDIIVKLLDKKFNIQLPKFWGLAYVDFTSTDFSKLFYE